MKQLSLPAAILRGGTSKGLFFDSADLPAEPARRDRLLMAALGSPDPYCRQIDGLGGATSSTSKVVCMNPSRRADCDAEYLFGAVSVDAPLIDWSGNCGNLTAAAALYALEAGWVSRPSASDDKREWVEVRLWQANTSKRIVAEVPWRGGAPEVEGTFRVAGLPRPGAEIRLTFEDPAGAGSPAGLLPTGEPVTTLAIPGLGTVAATLVDAGNPTVFVRAGDLGLEGIEDGGAIDDQPHRLQTLEAIRAHAAVAMNLARSPAEASERRPATPKIAWVNAPRRYTSSSGQTVGEDEIDLVARMLSMGRLHHAFTGTGAISLAVAAAIPGTVVNTVLGSELPRGPRGSRVCFGHRAGTMTLEARLHRHAGDSWHVASVTLGRTARRLMQGELFVPESFERDLQ